jgi:hypothetical protein
MSKVRSDNISNRADTGAPKLTFGAELPVGYGITGAGGINITGVATAASISATSISAASASFTGNISVGGTLTYEDVINVDSVGIITARTGIKVLAGGVNAVGVVTATSFVGSGASLTGVWEVFDTWLYGGG